MIISGAESAAAAIRSILIHIMATPRVYVKLKAEIKAAIEDGATASPIQMEQAENLPYLKAVIYEGIRSE